MSGATPAAAFGRFATGCRFRSAAPQGGGLINRGWRVTAEDGSKTRRFLLQRVNRQVFTDPDAMMANVARVTAHLQGRTPPEPTLEFLPTASPSGGHPWLWRDYAGQVWRLCRFLEGTRPLTAADGAAGAAAAGRAYGRFMRCAADLPATALSETLPGFHDTPARWVACRRAVAAAPRDRATGTGEVRSVLERHAELAGALAARALPVRVTHNDAKLANVLVGEDPDAPACVVDLDTVMAGTPLHDFGDLVRTACATADEEETDLARVAFDPDRYAALRRGYLAGADSVLTAAERDALDVAGAVIVFEQAVRFLTDHLSGDVYYRTMRPGHNLDRARNQARLLTSLLSHGAGR